MINQLLTGLVLFGSFGMRTPNNPEVANDDYELSTGVKAKNLFFKRDWERELGTKYIDDEMWFNTKTEKLYFKPHYVDKKSRDLTYFKTDFRYRKDDYSIGYTRMIINKNIENGLSAGIIKENNINDLISYDIKGDLYYFGSQNNENGSLGLETLLNINYKISERTVLTNYLDYKKIKDKNYYKFKIGIEYSFKSSKKQN